MTTSDMLSRKEGAVGWMIFNRPERHNAVSTEMWQAVPDILAGFDADPEVRVIVIRGAGERAFIAGADITQFERNRATPKDSARNTAIGNRGRDSIGKVVKPTIAMIHGYCLGGGMAVALGCDLRIASADARFGVPAAKLGNPYGYTGAKLISDRIGAALGKEMLFTGRQFDAQEALRMGLVNRVVPAAELEATVRSYADDIARNAPLTIAAAKLAFNAAERDPSERDLAALQTAMDKCVASEDIKEGRRAFAEKRKPVFRGV
ncbi:MAG: enoyl-CoA hydratase [Betaproteobacteria bacterium RIFCSPLOWO2_02_FULL_62_17]|nr:MAG: enoyl-CoA hydratase [Betaproteobacteria bacterium RIFCSPLOWO2_02_FULL_62_17]